MEIKNCPFCGSKAEVKTNSLSRITTYYWCSCDKCSTDSNIYEDEAKAIEMWNNRPIENELIEALEKAKETLENIVGYERIDGVPEYQQILDTLSKAKGEVK